MNLIHTREIKNVQFIFLWKIHGSLFEVLDGDNVYNSIQEKLKINLKPFLQVQKLHSNKKPGPYFEVSAIQASSVTLTLPGDENQS